MNFILIVAAAFVACIIAWVVTAVVYLCTVAAKKCDSAAEDCGKNKGLEIITYIRNGVIDREELKRRVREVLDDNGMRVRTVTSPQFGNEDGYVSYKDRNVSRASTNTLDFASRLYGKYSSGKDVLISFADIYFFAEDYNVSIDWLLGRSDRKEI